MRKFSSLGYRTESCRSVSVWLSTLKRDREFESPFLHRRVTCEPERARRISAKRSKLSPGSRCWRGHGARSRSSAQCHFSSARHGGTGSGGGGGPGAGRATQGRSRLRAIERLGHKEEAHLRVAALDGAEGAYSSGIPALRR